MRTVTFLLFVCLVISLGVKGSGLVGAEAEATEAKTKVLHHESFEDGKALGWKFYDNSLDFRDVMVDDEITHRESVGAMLGETNASSVNILKLLKNMSLSFPIREDVYLNFAYYCQADGPANDEIVVFVEGHGPDGKAFAGGMPIALCPALNKWNVVSVPLSACGAKYVGGALDGLLNVTWRRGEHDAHTLFVDDVKVTRGTDLPPLLIAPNSLQAVPNGIVVESQRYINTVRITAKLFCNAAWRIVLTDAQRSTLRTFSGDGSEVDVLWDGMDQQGVPAKPGEVKVRLEVEHKMERPHKVVATTSVMLSMPEGGPSVLPSQVLLAGGQPIDYDCRTAADNIVASDQLPRYERLVGPIELNIERGRRQGRALMVTLSDQSPQALPVRSADLTAGNGKVLASSHVAFKAVTRQRIDFGDTWRDAEIVNGTVNVDAKAIELELVVTIPPDLPVGVYRGLVKIGSDDVALVVKARKRTTPRRWWQGEKVKLMLAKPQVMPRPEFFLEGDKGYRQIAQAGFNVMIPYVGVDHHAEPCGRYARDYGLKMIARTPAPSYPRDDHEPLFVWPSGFKTPMFCPYSEEFWMARILSYARQLAEMSLGVPLVGFEYDFEMYWKHEKKYAHIYTHCYCDACWRVFVEQSELKIPSLETNKRHGWLVNNRQLAEYKVFQDERLREQVRRLKQVFEEINPDLQVMILAWGSGHFMEVVAKELASPRTPVILSTEHTYGRGRTPLGTAEALERHKGACLSGLREMKRLGIDGLYVPGVMPGHQKADPVFCRENAVTLSRYSDGYWVFFQQTEPNTTVADYMEQFKQANDRIANTIDP